MGATKDVTAFSHQQLWLSKEDMDICTFVAHQLVYGIGLEAVGAVQAVKVDKLGQVNIVKESSKT